MFGTNKGLKLAAVLLALALVIQVPNTDADFDDDFIILTPDEGTKDSNVITPSEDANEGTKDSTPSVVIPNLNATQIVRDIVPNGVRTHKDKHPEFSSKNKHRITAEKGRTHEGKAPRLSAAPVVGGAAGAAALIDLGIRVHNHLEKKKRDKMLRNPYPPSLTIPNIGPTLTFDLTKLNKPIFKPIEQIKKETVDWYEYQRKYHRERLELLHPFFDPKDESRYVDNREILLSILGSKSVEKKIEKKEEKKKIESSMARHKREHYNSRLTSINEKRRGADLPPLKTVEKGEKTPRIRDIDGAPRRMHGRGPGGVAE